MRIARPHTLALLAALAAVALIAVCFGAVRGELAVGSWGSPDAGGQSSSVSLADVPNAPARSGGDAGAAEAATVALAPAATVAASAPAGAPATSSRRRPTAPRPTARTATRPRGRRRRAAGAARGGRGPAGADERGRPGRADDARHRHRDRAPRALDVSSTHEGAGRGARPAARAAGCTGEVPAGVEVERDLHRHEHDDDHETTPASGGLR